MADHEHRWIETTTLLDKYETRVCAICKKEQRRTWRKSVLADPDEGWQQVN